MDDRAIIDLYFARAERAIAETARRYGRYCTAIAYRILGSREDSEECVNDTYLRAWNAIPPHRPERLDTYLGTITRNLALNRYAERNAAKRGGQVELALDELRDCLADTATVEDVVDNRALADALNAFLASLPAETRRIFVARYWHLKPIKTIARELHLGESAVKMRLARSREQLRDYLTKEGITL